LEKLAKLDIESIIRYAAKQEADLAASPAQAKKQFPGHQIPAASLSGWINIVNQAEVPAIDVNIIGEIQVASVLSFDQITHKIDDIESIRPGMELAHEELKWLCCIIHSLSEQEMLRWDTCAPFGVKYAMGKPNDPGRPLDESGYTFHLDPDDPRAFEILFEHPEPTIKIIKRPWVNALMMDGYPVEFRVFIKDDEVLGVSNYYLQRDLPVNDDILQLAELSADYARRIIKQCHESQVFPVNPQIEPGAVGYVTASLDFMVTETGELLFIEAGPGFGFGAHPCCYLDKNNLSPIEGIKLGVKMESVALRSPENSSDFELK